MVAFTPIKNISEAKAELSALLEAVQQGQEVIIAKAGKPIARLIKYEKTLAPRVPGSMAGQISVGAAFDSLPDDIADAFGMLPPPAGTHA